MGQTLLVRPASGCRVAEEPGAEVGGIWSEGRSELSGPANQIL